MVVKPKNMIKLNIGCGLTAPADWTNIDGSLNARLSRYPWLKKTLYKVGILPKRFYDVEWPQNIVLLDIRKGIPYENNSVKYIYCSHLLEHLTKQEATRFIEEAFRVLETNGIIRIIVPDLESLSRRYLESKKQSSHAADEFLENLNIIYRGSEEPSWIGFIRNFYNTDSHKWMYDYGSLSKLLKDIGFKEMEKKRYLESSIENIDVLERESAFSNGVCLEAKKI